MNGKETRPRAFALLAPLCAVALSGCCSCPRGDAREPVGGDSFAAGRLAATVEALDRTAADSRARIAGIVEESRGIEGGIERLEFLFGEYEHEVARILGEVDRIRGEAQDAGEGDTRGNSPPSPRLCGAARAALRKSPAGD